MTPAQCGWCKQEYKVFYFLQCNSEKDTSTNVNAFGIHSTKLAMHAPFQNKVIHGIASLLQPVSSIPTDKSVLLKNLWCSSYMQ